MLHDRGYEFTVGDSEISALFIYLQFINTRGSEIKFKIHFLLFHNMNPKIQFTTKH